MDLEKIEEILKNHENRIAKLENLPPHKITKTQNNLKKSITDLIVEIKSEGFFDKPKSRKDIIDKFEELGHIYEGSSLDSPLARALRSRVIGRKKIEGKWHYVNR